MLILKRQEEVRHVGEKEQNSTCRRRRVGCQSNNMSQLKSNACVSCSKVTKLTIPNVTFREEDAHEEGEADGGDGEGDEEDEDDAGVGVTHDAAVAADGQAEEERHDEDADEQEQQVLDEPRTPVQPVAHTQNLQRLLLNT